MKICLLAKRFYTGKDLIKDRYGRLYHLPKYWGEQGAEVDVIALDYRTTIIEQIQEGRLCIRSFPSNGAHLGAAQRAVEWGRYDVLIVSGHLNLARLALKLARRYSIPVIFDIYDYYPAFAGRLHPLFAAYMKRLLPRFDGVTVVSRALEDWASMYNPEVLRVPNGVDYDLFQGIPQKEARRLLDMPTEIPVLGLFGSVSEDLGASEVKEAFGRVLGDFPDARLLLAGNGSETLQDVAGAQNLGMLPQAELKRWASACDCLLIPYRDTLQVRYSQSSRLAEYLAIDRPVVVTRTGDSASWFPVNYAGWCVPGDAESMYQALVKQLELEERVPFPSELLWEELGGQSFIFIESIGSRERSKS